MIKANIVPTVIRGERIVCGIARWNLCTKNPPSQPTTIIRQDGALSVK